MRRMTVIVATFALSSSGMAAELSKNGPVEGRFYSHNVQKIDELQTADGMKAYVNKSFAFHVGKQHDGLFDGTTERCLGYGRVTQRAARSRRSAVAPSSMPMVTRISTMRR